MKHVFYTLLGISCVLLCYFCVMSVMTPIRFDEAKDHRQDLITAKLMQIRDIQVEYKNQYGHYSDSWDSIFNFARTGKKKEFVKVGELTDAQLQAGLTEQKAIDIIRKGKESEIKENGLENFRRDTIETPMMNIFNGVYDDSNIEQLAIVPYAGGEKEGNGTRFELRTNNEYTNASGNIIPLFEACVLYDVYLGDLDHQLLINLKDEAITLEKYPGLKVGSIEQPNNNAGNWE